MRTLGILALVIRGLAASPVRPDVVSTPSTITLRDAYGRWQLLVVENNRDVTHDATCASGNPAGDRSNERARRLTSPGYAACRLEAWVADLRTVEPRISQRGRGA